MLRSRVLRPVPVLLLALISFELALPSDARAQSVTFDPLDFPHVATPAPSASDLANLPGDLRAVPVPEPPNLLDFVADRGAAIRLGKALFWDMQVGSDGIQACASCHFRAGADPRSRNQLSPGLKRFPSADLRFATRNPNGQLRESDFPLSRLLISGVRGALDARNDSDDVVSSQGVHFLTFRSKGSRGHGPAGDSVALPDPEGFRIERANTRRVEPRNTPSVINAVFNHRQFWDGRAEAVFNGVNPFGARDPSASVARAIDPNAPEFVRIAIANASLASQAVGPIVSDLEMARPGRTPLELGRELLPAAPQGAPRPLAGQLVHPDDSVLGDLSLWPSPGLRVASYEEMIQSAFREEWWRSPRLVRIADDGTRSVVLDRDGDAATREYTLAQYNFALFFGLAIQLYEATLVSDDTPWDRFRRAHPLASDPALNPWTNENPDAIDRRALFGAAIFNDRTRGTANARCSNCHEQAELTDASVRRIAAAVNGSVRNRDGNLIDKGFNNIGVRPTEEDLGVGASDERGPLSHAKQRFGETLPSLPFAFDGANVTKGFGVEGAFKTPSLRNVALTAPYFHNGDALTLRQAVEFYSRGGNVAPLAQRTDGAPIEPLGIPAFSEREIDALVAFLESLSDERVRYRRAPFDHPELFVPNGHPGDEESTRDRDHDGLADDELVRIPPVGADGGPELPGFLAFGVRR